MLQPRVGLPVGDVDLSQAANDQLKGGTDVSKQAGGKQECTCGRWLYMRDAFPKRYVSRHI